MREPVELSSHRCVKERLFAETILSGSATTQQTVQEVGQYSKDPSTPTWTDSTAVCSTAPLT